MFIPNRIYVMQVQTDNSWLWYLARDENLNWTVSDTRRYAHFMNSEEARAMSIEVATGEHWIFTSPDFSEYKIEKVSFVEFGETGQINMYP